MTGNQWTAFRYAACGLALQSLAACGSPERAETPVPVNTATPAPTGVAGRAANDQPVSGPPRLVVAFGDSLYAGYRLGQDESLPAMLEDRLRAQGIDATVVNAGVSGDTTAAGRQRLAFTLDNLDRAPDLVVLGLGGNDMLRQIPAAETRANLEAMMAELSRRGVPVILTGMLAAPNLGPDYRQQFESIYPTLAAEHEAALDPFILDGVIGRQGMMLPDGIHPSAAGVSVIADRLAPLVADRLRQEAE